MASLTAFEKSILRDLPRPMPYNTKLQGLSLAQGEYAGKLYPLCTESLTKTDLQLSRNKQS